MFLSVNVLDLPNSAKFRIKRLGYEFCDDLERALLGTGEVPRELTTLNEQYNLRKVLSATLAAAAEIPRSAADLRNFECQNPPVSIFHEGLDKITGGGLPTGRITEICGAPGSGKTQICLQAAIDVQIPRELGGSDGESLYVSTDFGFTVGRLRQMARESVRHVAKTGRSRNFTLESVLSGVNVTKTCGYRDLFRVISNLGDYLDTNRRIKLVIIDSFSLPFVSELTETIERTRLVHVMLDKLQELAVRHQFAVLLTNQLTTVVASRRRVRLIPSLGDGFGHRMHKRLHLDDGKICLVKSIDEPRLVTNFQVTSAGIR